MAEMPLGTYRGRIGDREVDRLPSPARLLSALVAAAASGPRAVVDGDQLAPRAEDLAALRWLEEHPPDGMRVPHVHVNRIPGIAYRIKLLGPLKKSKESGRESRRFAKAATTMASVALAGPVAWTWREPPPLTVRAALADLCRDVSHLGTAETPVRLRVTDVEPTHDLDLDADWWRVAENDLDAAIPQPGRTTALLESYHTYASTPVRGSEQVAKGGEHHHLPPLVTTGLAEARYVARAPKAPRSPWIHALVASLSWGGPSRRPAQVPEAWRVRWAVAIHKALIALVGDGAPAVLTGAYASGVPRPTNRCAIQFVDARLTPHLGGDDEHAMAVLMIPAGIDPGDLLVVADAWRQLSHVRGPGGLTLHLHDQDNRRGDRFWPDPAGDRTRRWRTVPAAVPEIRGQGRGWSLADTVAVSVGMVFRDRLAGPGRGTAWYRALAAAAVEAGQRTHAVSMVRDGDLSRFVHRTPENLIIRPYRAELELGGLTDDRSIVAIGQSRHLGGGLLVPVDLADRSGVAA